MKTYIALLRGINVGGNKRVEMVRLKALFESLGFSNIKTYINSGNIIFTSDQKDTYKICKEVEQGIEIEFGFAVPVVIKSAEQLMIIAEAIPKEAQNNSEMKCDILFLWEEVDRPEVLDDLNMREDIDQVKCVPGAIIWSVNRVDIGKSSLLKIVGTPFYKKVTIRNCNTVRKLVELVS